MLGMLKERYQNLVKTHQTVGIDLGVSDLWHQFKMILKYKCERYGKQLHCVNPYKTSQYCSHCGYDSGKKSLDIRQWRCPSCHTAHDRDINAAKNIKSIGLEQA